MSTRFFNLLLSRFELSSGKYKAGGFTLVELLVSIIMAGIIVSSLLYMVVQLLQTDQQESARNQTQADMQTALDYIASDLREAVYVYDDLDKIKDYLPAFNTAYQPILAFWKSESINQQSQTLPTAATCNSFTDALKKDECNSLRNRQNTYTLIVYLQARNSPTSTTWQGKSVIRRYQLRKYISVNTLALSTGYVDPAQQTTNFKNWPKDGAGNNLQSSRPIAPSNIPALVDFVDDPDNRAFNDPDNNSNSCAPPKYKRTPTTSTSRNNSFFAYVRTEADTLGFNQDVCLFLRGNPTTNNGGIINVSNNLLPTLQTQVITRGVIDKVPPQ